MKKRVISFVLIVSLMLTLLPITVFADEKAERDINEACELYFDGEPGWRVYPADGIDGTLTLDGLNIELRTKEGDVVDPSLYTLSVKVQVDWDDENDCPITADAEEPFGITGEENRQSGFQSYYAYIEAKQGSGYQGDMSREFMIWDQYSFNWFGANAGFGEEYERPCTWSWHNYYKIPTGAAQAPTVRGISMNGVDPQYYEITYFQRVTDIPVSDGPDYQAKVYPETDPLDTLPTEPGSYFARIDGKAPYYGTSYVDFDIVDPVSYVMVQGSEERFFEKDTVNIKEDETVYICFSLEPSPFGLIPGWNPDSLRAAGFTVADEPEFNEEEGRTYLKISAEDLEAGICGTLSYFFVRAEDVFGEHAVGWENAKAVTEGSVSFEVQSDPQGFILGDADQDGVVSILDATTIQKKRASIPVSPFCPPAADTNRNGLLDILDATTVQKHLARLELPDQQEPETPGVYGTYYASWNMSEKLLPDDSALQGEDAYIAECEIRKALSLLIDRDAVLRSAGIERKFASSFVSNWITDADGTEFVTHTGADAPYGYFDPSKAAYQSNRDQAVEILKQYYNFDEATEKFTNVPTLSYLFNEGDVHRRISEAIRDCYKELGIELTLDETSWGEYSDAIASKDYSLCRSGWVVDFDDPLEFLSMWTSYSEDNDAGLGRDDHGALHIYDLDLTSCGFDYRIRYGDWSQTYDKLIETISRTRNKETRYQLSHLAEDMLMDTGCIVPIYYY